MKNLTDKFIHFNQNTSKRKKRLLGASAVFLFLMLLYCIYWLFEYAQISTDDAYVHGNLVPVMSQISGQVATISTDETDSVAKGQQVVTLDHLDAEIALNTAKAELALTTRQVSQLFHHMAELQANLSIAQNNLDKAIEDFDRRKGLVINKSISSEDLNHAQTTKESAKNAFELAKQQLISASALVGNTDLYHHPQVEKAATNLKNAYLNWKRTCIYAPDSGYVAKRAVQVGQQVSPNTVLMIIVPLNQIWINANFKESQLKNIRIGQPVKITVDAYGSGVIFHGKVVGLSPGTGTTFDLLPPQNATGNWIKVVQRLPVRIAIDPQDLKKHPLRIGLSTTVTINTNYREGNVLSMNQPSKIIYASENFHENFEEADELIHEILKSNTDNITYIAE